MSAITDELHRIAEALRAEGHHLADRLHAAISSLHHDEAKLKNTAEQDAARLVTEAKPVMQEAQADAETLAADAARAAETAITTATEPAAQPPAAPSA